MELSIIAGIAKSAQLATLPIGDETMFFAA